MHFVLLLIKRSRFADLFSTVSSLPSSADESEAPSVSVSKSLSHILGQVYPIIFEAVNKGRSQTGDSLRSNLYGTSSDPNLAFLCGVAYSAQQGSRESLQGLKLFDTGYDCEF